MDTSDFDYYLPRDLIAQEPIEPRDAARLLVADPLAGDPAHRQVRDLDALLRPGDLLVMNRTRVIPARLSASTPTGGEREILLITPLDPAAGERWSVYIGGKARPGMVLDLHGVPVTVESVHEDGTRVVTFPAGVHVLDLADRHGHIPLPPYIQRADRPADRDRYQTVFADRPGSVAAPTAGLHLTTALLDRLRVRGVKTAFVELAIGPGTFKPVDTTRVEDYRIHSERGDCPAATVDAVRACKARGGRVIAVGTTSVRTLETAARQPGGLGPWQGWTALYLYPPQTMQVVDGLLTNFHLPQSSLLMLVACLTGTERLHGLYAHAIRDRYRFYSYGDTMLLLPGGCP